jgi:D-arabinose 1-dehydrogenase-like Zn-dependent alcohol dehydrogenase
MPIFHAYAATNVHEPLKPFTFDPGELGPYVVHNTKRDGELAKIAGSLDLIISTVNVPLDVPALLGTLAPNGILHVAGAALEPGK